MAVSFGSRTRGVGNPWDADGLVSSTYIRGSVPSGVVSQTRNGVQQDVRPSFQVPTPVGSTRIAPPPPPTPVSSTQVGNNIDIYGGYQAPTGQAAIDAFRNAVSQQYGQTQTPAQSGTPVAGYTPPSSADEIARFAAALSGSGGGGGMFGGQPSAEVSPEYFANKTDDPFLLWKTNQMLGGATSQPSSSMGVGGGASSAAAQAAARLAAYQNYINQAQAATGSRYDAYQKQLADAAQAAMSKIGDVGAETVDALGQMDPMAAFQFYTPPSAQPMAGATNYLQAIGASTADVDAARALQQQLMGQQLASAEQFAMGEQDALAKERQARLAAARLASQEALGGVSSQQLAYQAQVDAARNAELQALQQALLEAQLNYG